MNFPEDSYAYQEPRNPIARGAFIAIEGLDRAGKTTQARRLCHALYHSGSNVKSMRFPDRTTAIGLTINTYLTAKTAPLPDQAIHLLFSANRWELAAEIHTRLAAGYSVICDRYYYSGMVYSAAKQNSSLDLAWARQPEVGLPKPDLVIFLDLEPEVQQERAGWGEERYEEKGMQARVRAGFLSLREKEEGRVMRVVNAATTIDHLEQELWGYVESVVREAETGVRGKEVALVEPW